MVARSLRHTMEQATSYLLGKISLDLVEAGLEGREMVGALCRLFQMLAATGRDEVLRIDRPPGHHKVCPSAQTFHYFEIRLRYFPRRDDMLHLPIRTQTDLVFLFKHKAPALFLTRLPTQKEFRPQKARRTRAFSNNEKPLRPRYSSPSPVTLKSLAR